MATQSHWKLMTITLCVALMLVVGAGCKSKKDDSLATGLEDIDPNEGSGMEETTGDGLPNLDLENILFDSSSDSGLKAIYFDYDSASLRPDAMATLRANAEKIKGVPGVIIQVAGHCDERGTQEYNLALGERRSLSVREHLIQLGVSGDRMITISYGEEFPIDLGPSEAAWSKNRRCEFNKAQSL